MCRSYITNRHTYKYIYVLCLVCFQYPPIGFVSQIERLNFHWRICFACLGVVLWIPWNAEVFFQRLNFIIIIECCRGNRICQKLSAIFHSIRIDFCAFQWRTRKIKHTHTHQHSWIIVVTQILRGRLNSTMISFSFFQLKAHNAMFAYITSDSKLHVRFESFAPHSRSCLLTFFATWCENFHFVSSNSEFFRQREQNVCARFHLKNCVSDENVDMSDNRYTYTVAVILGHCSNKKKKKLFFFQGKRKKLWSIN